jgi:hypothetical protein
VNGKQGPPGEPGDGESGTKSGSKGRY